MPEGAEEVLEVDVEDDDEEVEDEAGLVGDEFANDPMC